MLNHLQQKWKVNGWRLVLIIATFALGGSLCGYAGRKLMPVLRIEHPVAWTLVYILLVTILWPLSILIISIPLGQFPFFTKYLYTIGARLGLAKKPPITMKKRIAVFASGTGTNAARLIQYSKDEKAAFEVALVACNKPGAGVLNIAAANRIPVLMIEKETFFRGNAYLDELAEIKIDFIVLAGFLWKIPNKLVGAYRNRIINIHPALLPNYGGKGMYGNFVHEAVIAAGDPESGITIHWVDEHYDHGSQIFQARCPVLPGDTPSTLASRIHKLEHRHYPEVVNQVISDMMNQS